MLDTTAALRRTPFYPRHVASGAKMVPFAGHEMPIQYEGILAEHRAVRSSVGVFDVSHMGEIRLTGPGAAAFANRLVTNEAGDLPDGKVVYSPMCLENGGIVDDLLVYAIGADRLLVVNAANFEKDLAWVRDQAPLGVTVLDENEETAQLAVQGPRAEAVVAALYPRAASLGFYESFVEGAGDGWTLVSRTGYTGEDGFEIYVRAPRALALWDAVFGAGAAEGIRPIGLGARDTLRLEMGYCLYGNDIDETTNPIEAGLGWTVRLNKEKGFIGRDAIGRVKETGPARTLLGLVLEGERIARQGFPVVQEGRSVGTVTSGSMGISLGRPVAMGYLEGDAARAGARVEILARGQGTPAVVSSRPMYRDGSVRSPKPRRAG